MEFNATFLVSIVSFILFVVIMNAIFYVPIRNIMLARKNYIDEKLGDADLTNKKAQGLLDDKDSKLKSAQIDAKNFISSGVEDVKNQNQESISQKQKEAFEKIESGKNDLASQKNSAKNDLKSNVSDIAKSISEKILGEKVSELSADKSIIDEVIDNV